MSFRTILILINLVAIVGLLGLHRVPRRQPAAEPGAEAAREPHAVLRRRRARGPAPRARARRRRSIALVVVVARARSATSSGSRSARPTPATGFKDRSVERGAMLFANAPVARRTTARSRCCARTATASTAAAASATFVVKSDDPRCDPKQKVNDELADEQPYCLPQQVAWAGAQPAARAAAVLARAAHPDHHLRPTRAHPCPRGAC